MDNEKLRKGLEGVMSKAGWTEDGIIDFVRDNLKSLVEIDESELWKELKHWFPDAEYLTGVVELIAKENLIKLKEE